MALFVCVSISSPTVIPCRELPVHIVKHCPHIVLDKDGKVCTLLWLPSYSAGCYEFIHMCVNRNSICTCFVLLNAQILFMGSC